MIICTSVRFLTESTSVSEGREVETKEAGKY